MRPQPLPTRCQEHPSPSCDDQIFPKEQNLPAESQGLEDLQSPSLALTCGTEIEASCTGAANSADLPWPPRVHHTSPSQWKELSLMAFQLEPKIPSQSPPR